MVWQKATKLRGHRPAIDPGVAHKKYTAVLAEEYIRSILQANLRDFRMDEQISQHRVCTTTIDGLLERRIGC
jgi:hypothetical protein